MNHGISTLQGPHHVAQKSSRMTLPLSDSRLSGLLFTSLRVYLRGAGLAFTGHAGPPGAAAAARSSSSVQGSAPSVSNARAVQLTIARAQRSFISGRL